MNAKDKILTVVFILVIFYLLFQLLQAMFNYDLIPWIPVTDILTLVLFLPLILIISIFSSIGIVRLLSNK